MQNNIRAQIALDEHRTISADVVSRSEAGARLKVEDAFAVPDTFVLTVSGAESFLVCNVTTRLPGEIGVRFT
ncbi:PilZ domain-containing protein [Methylobacterium oxalidis]|uniref:PilZ domain-containing protein n=1 Tax=Methylobacterium oxalidis TaxID=944322 RepID=UPI001EDC9EA7|nr:PilZ domain-containing protein [Methylobacterium oxalidis]